MLSPQDFASLRNDFSLRSRISGKPNRLFGIIKLILGILILPFAYSVSVSFLNEFRVIEKFLQNYFWTGAISLLAVYLFVWEPAKIYAKGQRLLEAIFRFFAPLVKVAPYLLPIYFILIFLGYLVLSLVIKSQTLLNYSVFLFGFSLTFHLVFSAKSIRYKQGDFLKANYIFGFSLIYIINLVLLSLCLSIIFGNFSFVNFTNHSFQITKGIFGVVFEQLFL